MSEGTPLQDGAERWSLRSDQGELVGQQVAAKTLEDIAAELRRIEPPAFPDIETVNLKEGRAAIVLTVPGGGGPYTFDGRPYLQHGPTTAIMPREEYERRLVERLHAFGLLRRAESFLLDHVPIAGRVIPGKLVREDRPLYPPRATREAIANAICHRDYTIPGGAVAIAMYDDHLEITNPGAFHFGITPEKLTQPHESKPWNPIIANVFYRAGIIERWGMGTLNIIEWCTENGNPAPNWSEQAGSVFVIFFAAGMEEAGTKLALSRHQVEAQEAQVEAQEAQVALTAVERAILGSCIDEPRASHELAAAAGYATRTGNFKRSLEKLLARGLIEMTIPDKPRSSKQKYRVTEKGRQVLAKSKGNEK